MRVTINDIAKLAKVSPSTVSRVIADNPRISKATREKVLKIMKDNNYHPHIIARSLASKSTKIIGVVIPSTAEKALRHPFFSEILRGIGSIAYKNKYNILIGSASDLKEERNIIDEFARGGITEGIILLTSRTDDPAITELNKIGFPYVVVGRPDSEYTMNWVDNDNIAAGYQMTEHLIKQGHKRIAYLGLSPQFIVTTDRLLGYKKALHDYGLEVDDELIVEGRFIDDTGYGLMKALLDKSLEPTAVVACDDILAFGAIKLIFEYGLQVPDDIAVAGFNNVPLSDYFIPSLTSVEINPFGLGTKAFELLYSAICSEFKCQNRVVVPSEVIVRNSTVKKQ